MTRDAESSGGRRLNKRVIFTPNRKLDTHIHYTLIERVEGRNETKEITSSMTSTTCIDRIDIHHHFFPPSLSRVKAAQSRGVGFITPPENLPWSADLSLRAMDSLGIQLAALSLPSGIAETIDEAKKANVQMHEVVQQHEDRFAFWGCLGDWRDIEGDHRGNSLKSADHLANIATFQARCNSSHMYSTSSARWV